MDLLRFMRQDTRRYLFVPKHLASTEWSGFDSPEPEVSPPSQNSKPGTIVNTSSFKAIGFAIT